MNKELWYKFIKRDPFVEIWLKGFENLPKEFQDFFLGFSIADTKEDGLRKITLCDAEKSDKEIIKILVNELKENNFQEI